MVGNCQAALPSFGLLDKKIHGQRERQNITYYGWHFATYMVCYHQDTSVIVENLVEIHPLGHTVNQWISRKQSDSIHRPATAQPTVHVRAALTLRLQAAA